MRRSLCGGIVALALLALPVVSAVASGRARLCLKAPYRAFEQHEFGASLSDPGEGAGIALEGFYRFGKDKNDFSVRAGVADVRCRRQHLFSSVGTSAPRWLSYSECFPLDGSLTVGFGGDLRLPTRRTSSCCPSASPGAGASSIEGSTTTFVPYVHPNLVPVFGGGDVSCSFTLGLGVDVRFGEQWAVRASGGLGDIEGVGLQPVVPALTPTAYRVARLRRTPRPGARVFKPEIRLTSFEAPE